MTRLENTNPYRTPESSNGPDSSGKDESFIRVTRTKSYADRLRAYRILIDGVERAKVSAGTSVEIPVTPGSHSVVAKVDWCSSPTLVVMTQPRSVAKLQCESNLQGMRIFLAIIYTTLFRDKYLTLRQV